jgi:hypothetical protein
MRGTNIFREEGTMAGSALRGTGHHPGAEHPRFGHVLRIAWIVLLVILVLLVFAPKAGGTRDLMASAAMCAD